MGSGCGAVGRVVAFDSRSPLFEPNHLKFLIYAQFAVWKRQN